MPDMEKVIKGLEHCSSEEGCRGCPYNKTESGHACSFDCIRDALALLKEQETANLYKCPNCGTWVSAENVVWCKDCKHAGEDCEIAFHFGEKDDWFCADGKRKVGEGDENP